ncbi:hypothetical protein J2751_000603 [Halorubrum alkaliphilum]|uniref:Uncharacterized protein n=1 Tax=Halorubrum alkaliphilum TaxID=261290 RepID=A0A8T4GD86_9EURY|nr:hypothetical protein [Halorubrum alkaliphilum]MBP1921610.1 hypothetical protein [Halorubrum alkaliphilum]
MEFDRYREAVAANRREHDFDALDGRSGFDRLWTRREEDPTVGSVSLFGTVVDATDYDADDLADTADRFRAVVDRRTDDGDESVTRIGYVVFVVSGADDALSTAAAEYTVAERRTNVFPLVYDTETRTLHTHSVPRLKGRGIYRRQADDAERLFEV